MMNKFPEYLLLVTPFPVIHNQGCFFLSLGGHGRIEEYSHFPNFWRLCCKHGALAACGCGHFLLPSWPTPLTTDLKQLLSL